MRKHFPVVNESTGAIGSRPSVELFMRLVLASVLQNGILRYSRFENLRYDRTLPGSSNHAL